MQTRIADSSASEADRLADRHPKKNGASTLSVVICHLPASHLSRLLRLCVGTLLPLAIART
jgi:hypothetical protein